MESRGFPLRHARRAYRSILSFVLAAALTAVSVSAAGDVSVVRRCETEEKWIALTFDDGPHKTHTPEILALLREYHVPATFFIVGSNAELCPEIVEAILSDGHEIGNHTYSHAYLGKRSRAEMENEIDRCARVLAEQFSYETTLLRPPGGCVSATVCREAEKRGYTVVLWSVDPRDWAHTKTEKIVENVRANAKPGDILLFHDYISGETHTLEALRILIPEMLAAGYHFVTVSELLDAD